MSWHKQLWAILWLWPPNHQSWHMMLLVNTKQNDSIDHLFSGCICEVRAKGRGALVGKNKKMRATSKTNKDIAMKCVWKSNLGTISLEFVWCAMVLILQPQGCASRIKDMNYALKNVKLIPLIKKKGSKQARVTLTFSQITNTSHLPSLQNRNLQEILQPNVTLIVCRCDWPHLRHKWAPAGRHQTASSFQISLKLIEHVGRSCLPSDAQHGVEVSMPVHVLRLIAHRSCLRTISEQTCSLRFRLRSWPRGQRQSLFVLLKEFKTPHIGPKETTLWE